MKLKSLLVMTTILLAGVVSAMAADVPRMSTEELNSRLGEADLVIVDARSGRDWNNSNQVVAGAIRGNPNDTVEWEAKLTKDQVIVLYCT